jgi:hypothetical protein
MRRREMVALAGLACAASIALVRVVNSATVETGGAADSFRVSVAPRRVSDDSLVEAASTTVTNDPFRLANHPATVRFAARNEGGAAPPPPAPRPTMTVQAIIGGPPWQAIVDGIPGEQPGVIVRTGSTYGKLVVRSVGRDTVTMQAPDTTWKLTLKRDHP